MAGGEPTEGRVEEAYGAGYGAQREPREGVDNNSKGVWADEVPVTLVGPVSRVKGRLSDSAELAEGYE